MRKIATWKYIIRDRITPIGPAIAGEYREMRLPHIYAEGIVEGTREYARMVAGYDIATSSQVVELVRLD